MLTRLAIVALTTALLGETAAHATCVNRFTYRAAGPRHIVTLLTGKLTYQAAKDLSVAIRDGKASPIEWVSESGKPLGTQFGDLQVLKPMPVSCDSTPSGVVMSVTFVGGSSPARKIVIKFDPKTMVEFEEQK